MSGLSREMAIRSYAKYLTPDHLFLMAYWAGKISARLDGSVEAEELIQECWLHYGRYTKSVKRCSYAIKAFMWHRAQRIQPRGCGLFIEINPAPELDHISQFDESEEHRYRRELLEVMLSVLDPRTQVIFQLHLNGLTWNKIGFELELSGERARQLFQIGLHSLLPTV